MRVEQMKVVVVVVVKWEIDGEEDDGKRGQRRL